ncbi:MAG: V-type ATP synthase subunit A, partial [Clostridia bacterium]|nr:V-type ATP synthase subunit A [Clostridia bacterium]
MVKGIITKISGPLVVASGMRAASMFDMVRIGELGLTGEIIEIHGDKASIQVYEETAGLRPGEEVICTGLPLSVELGPGLIKSIFDGIQRPLEEMYRIQGYNIKRGLTLPALDRKIKWHFSPACKAGDVLSEGDVIGTVKETELVTQRIMLPKGVSGTVKEIREGDFTVDEPVGTLTDARGREQDLKMMTTWPIRVGRPYAQKLPPTEPLSTGQRNIDTLCPIAKGGAAAIPGPFGSGKTVVQHQLAKWAQADIVVYIGCGERGNEMTDVLNEFPEIIDPRSGKSLMERTVLIANTSDMPVAAREASIYTGI